MRAIVIRKLGAVDVVEPAELKMPLPGPGEMLIRVAASSVNPVDW